MVICRDETVLKEEAPYLVRHHALKESENRPELFHYHDFCEITYIESGSGVYYVNGKSYEVEAGDIVIFNQEEPHGWEVRSGVMDVLVLIFLPNLLAEQTNYYAEEYFHPVFFLGSGFQNRIEAEDERNHKILVLMQEILEEAKGSESGYECVIRSDILKILILLIRYFEKKDSHYEEALAEKKKKIRRLEEALNYINENYTYTITLEQVAALSFMSPTYFSAYFKKVTNRSFSDYVTSLRLNRAKELIARGEDSMTEIAMKSGFHNMSNFYRLYKKHIGPLK